MWYTLGQKRCYYEKTGKIIKEFLVEETVMDMLVRGDAAWLYALLSNSESVPFSDHPGKTNAMSLTFHRNLMRVIHQGIAMTKGENARWRRYTPCSA